MPTPWLDPRLRKNFDWFLMGIVVVLVAAGLVFLSSAVGTLPSGQSMVAKQGLLIGIGVILLIAFASVDYGITARFSGPIYQISVGLLLCVALFFQDEATKGAARWIPLPLGFKLQPSEFAKIALILTLSAHLVRLGGRIREIRSLAATVLHVAVPMGLVAAQPDLTTALVFGTIWLAMVFVAGADLRHLAALLAAGGLLFAVAWNSGVVKQYQKDRVLILLGLKQDSRKLGYQIDQALAAIGGGQTLGQGLGQGIQNRGRWVPENHTDFIFTVVAEETGFVGSALLLGAYGLLLARGLSTASQSEDTHGRLVAVGVTTLFAFHTVVNIGMNCGVLPVAGVPLPLVSQGGSSAWTSLSAIGLLQSVAMRRRRLQF